VFKLGGKPVTKLAKVVSASTGTKTLPVLKGYKQVDKWLWVNAAKKACRPSGWRPAPPE